MRLSLRSSAQIAAQCTIGLVALSALSLSPPAEGKMLIVSLGGESPSQIAGWAAASGARIVGTGPMGSLVVEGRSADLSAKALRRGSILVAGPALECGSLTQ
jgi:hypothetical protein